MSSRCAVALCTLLLYAGAAIAADLSPDQVKLRLRSASASAPADFSGKDLSDIDLGGIDFRNAKLQGASLFASKLVNADFRGADLRGANLNGAWLMGTDFGGADLSGASLLSVVVLGGTVKKMPNFAGAKMAGVKIAQIAMITRSSPADTPGTLSGTAPRNEVRSVNAKSTVCGVSSANRSGVRYTDW